MGKTIRRNNSDTSKHQHRSSIPNNVAKGMIISGQGNAQVFGDRRDKRSKDAKRSWERDYQENGYVLSELIYVLSVFSLFVLLVWVVVPFIIKFW